MLDIYFCFLIYCNISLNKNVYSVIINYIIYTNVYSCFGGNDGLQCDAKAVNHVC